MCGICGIIDIKNEYSFENRSKAVANMNAANFHRGPDEDGVFQDESCSLAMRRLSIIDLQGGQQPIFNEAGDVLAFQNGEIYNYRELKQQLINKGHHFKTNSDTEVLVHLYEEYGTKMLEKLKGMYAFCVYHKKHKKFLLGRDRFGEKPLYYYFNGDSFIFSSEIHSLLQSELVPKSINYTALFYYLRTSLIPDPDTLLTNVRCLPPGHFIEISESGINIQKYYHFEYKPDDSIKTLEDAIAFIRPSLEKAVSQQMVSDVPIGAFLSGGIDSSTIVALLQKSSTQRINTFTVKFEDQKFDESKIAREVAKYWGTNHHEVTVPNFDFSEEIFWNIIEHVGFPFRDSSAIPTYFISKEIKKYVKVALSGDGGDELFGGYQLFQWYQKILNLKNWPTPIRKIGHFSLGKISELKRFEQIDVLRKLNRGISTSLYEEKEIPIALNEMFTDREISDLLGQNLNKLNLFDDYHLLKSYPDTFYSWSNLRKIMHYRLVHTLPNNMLVKVDRMSMANSLEVRAPFLDHELFEKSISLPDKFLIKNGKGKYIIREMMSNDLPEIVFNHPKQGFSIPLYRYQNEQFQKLARYLLFENNPLSSFFKQEELKKIYVEGLNNQANNAKTSTFRSAHKLWMIMQLIGWVNKYKVTL